MEAGPKAGCVPEGRAGVVSKQKEKDLAENSRKMNQNWTFISKCGLLDPGPYFFDFDHRFVCSEQSAGERIQREWTGHVHQNSGRRFLVGILIAFSALPGRNPPR